MQKLPERYARAPKRHRRIAIHPRSLELADHRRQHMPPHHIVVVARSIEVGRHQRMIDNALVAPQELAELQAGDLRERIPLVRLLQRRGEQCRFGDRLRRHARIDAGGTQKQQPLHARLVGAHHGIHRDERVLVEERGVAGGVRADATDARRADDGHVGLLGRVERADRRRIEKIQFLVCARDEIRVAGGVQGAHDGAPHHAPVPRHIDLARLMHWQAPPPCGRVRDRHPSSSSRVPGTSPSAPSPAPYAPSWDHPAADPPPTDGRSANRGACTSPSPAPHSRTQPAETPSRNASHPSPAQNRPGYPAAGSATSPPHSRRQSPSRAGS